jgi:hypothetical protein
MRGLGPPLLPPPLAGEGWGGGTACSMTCLPPPGSLRSPASPRKPRRVGKAKRAHTVTRETEPRGHGAKGAFAHPTILPRKRER